MSQQEKTPIEEKSSKIVPILWNPITQILGSMPFALTILVLLTIAMAWATRVDALYGAECSAWSFYRAGWFIFLLATLGVSAVCATLNPKRWTKRHVGFLTIHAGVLVLLLGCAISLIWGWEADLTVYEGCQKNEAVATSHVLKIRVCDKDPSDQIEKSNEEFETKGSNTPDSRSLGSSVPQSLPLNPGPVSWSQYQKLGFFPWGMVKPAPSIIFSDNIDGVNVKVSLLDFRKPYQEINIGQTLTLGVRPATKSETAQSVTNNPTSGTWTEINLQATRSIQDGLVGRSRLTGGQQVSYRKITNPAQLQSFLNVPPKVVVTDTFTFVHAGKTYQFTLKDFLPEGKTIADLRNGDDAPLPKIPLGDDVQLTLINMEDAMGAAVFEVSVKNESGEFEQVGAMTLLCLLSEFNRNDPTNDVYGEYFRVEPKTTESADETNPMASMRTKLLGPRLELAMDDSGQMYYRTVIDGKISAGEFNYLTPTLVFAGTAYAAVVEPKMDAPGVRYKEIVLEEQKPSENDPAAVLLNVECDGKSVQRWVTLGVNNPTCPPEWYRNSDYWTIPVKTDKGTDRWLVITAPRKTIDLGFNVMLEQFNRRLDPGTSMPSHYSSDVTVTYSDKDKKTSKKYEHVNIQLNQPVNFVNPNNGQSYRLYQSSFNGPLDKSGSLASWVLSQQTVKTNPSAPLYSSTFTVNYDPGRGLLYLGCLMICAGIGAFYYLKGPKPKKKSEPEPKPQDMKTEVNTTEKKPVVTTASILLLLAVTLMSRPVYADNYQTLATLPVLDSGRVEPLSTAALEAVRSICGTDSPTLSLDGAEITGELSADSASRITRHFCDGNSRKFSALELYWLWQAEPEVWEHIPFIECKNPDLRRLLGVPLVDKQGHALKYVSPRQAVKSTILPDFRYNLDTQIQQEQRASVTHQPSKLEKSVLKLFEAVELYRQITFYPPASENARSSCATVAGRLLQNQLAGWGTELEFALKDNANESVQKTPQQLAQYGETLRMMLFADEKDQNTQRIDRSLESFIHLIDLYTSGIETAIEALKSNKSKVSLVDQLQSAKNDLSFLRYHLYDEGGLPGVVPSLNPLAVDLWRTPEDRVPVWIPVTVLLYGDKSVLDGYPEPKIDAFRQAWNKAVKATASNDVTAMTTAQQELVSALSDLGRFADSKRNALLPENRLDKKVLSASQYPIEVKAKKLIQWECLYYQSKPFAKSLLFSMLSTACLIILIFVKRFKWLVTIPVTLMIIAVAYSGFGLGLRGYIMSRSPVANMFETIMFVAFMSGLMGLILPLAMSYPDRLRQAWNNTAFRFDCPLKRYWLVQSLRWIIGLGLFYMMVFVSYGAGQGYSAVSLLPRLAYGASFPCLSDLFVWISSLSLLAIVVLYVPRVFTMVFMNTWGPLERDQGTKGPRDQGKDSSGSLGSSVPQSLTRLPLLCSSALMTLLTAVAIHAPMFNDSLKNLMPILRDNFWLGVHVISIVGGYGTAMLAWALGVASLCAYCVGKYSTDDSGTITAPAITATMSKLMYLCVQATIWLLAIGIILGGLWADVSWGRFWSWDRKEVWALISMFVYLVFVHARHWGWFKQNRDMTMALTSVFGALAILMAWYGVNYILGSAMHGYATGSGGLLPAIAFAIANLLLAIMAMTRYVSERR